MVMNWLSRSFLLWKFRLIRQGIFRVIKPFLILYYIVVKKRTDIGGICHEDNYRRKGRSI